MSKINQHKFTPEQLSAYLDGQLGETERQELERHLGQCPDCRTILEKLSQTDQSVQRAEKVTAPAGYFDTFGSGVANRIAARKLRTAKAPWLVRWGWLPAAATVAGLALILIRGDLTQREYLQPAPKKAPEPPATAVSQPQTEVAKQAEETPVAQTIKQAPRDEIGAVRDKKDAISIPAGRNAEQNLTEAPPPEPRASIASAGAAKDMATMESMEPVDRVKKVASSERATALKSVAPAAPAVMVPGTLDRTEQQETKEQSQLAKQKTEIPITAPTRGNSKPSQPVATGAFSAPPGVNEVEVIMICLPDGKPDCPEPKVEKVIEIRVPGM